MPAQVERSSVFDSVLPNVYVKKVTLTPATFSGDKLGYEYDLGANDELQTNRFGKKQFLSLSYSSTKLNVEFFFINGQ